MASNALAQSAPLHMGARALGMGNASACLADIWSLNNNIAGLTSVEHTGVAASYHAIPTTPFFNRMTCVGVMPLRSAVAGVGIFRFGDDLYNEHVISLGGANTFGIASLGARINFIQYRADGQETHSSFTLSFGGIARITPVFRVGAHIVNINQPDLDNGTGERLPTIIIAGTAFMLSAKLIAVAEIEKDLRYTPTLKGGIEYSAFEKIAFRTGVNLNPESTFFGMGFKTRRFVLDYAFQWNYPIGGSHQASAEVFIGKK